MPPFARPDISDPPRRRLLRAAAVLTATVALHLLAYLWMDDRLGTAVTARPQPPVLIAELKLPAVPELAPPPPPPAKEAPPRREPRRAKPRSVPAPPAQAAARPASTASEPQAEHEADATSSMASTSPSGAASATVVAEAKPETPEPVQNPVPPAGKPPLSFSPPPPAELHYDVAALREGQNWHGKGLFRWETSENRYAIHGEASVTLLFKITVLNVASEGLLLAHGLAPVRYSEKPFRRSLTNTHFQHEQGKISFSASQATYPYQGGEQDRISTVWQLAGIGRGNPEQFVPGENIELMVAGTRDAETWKIKVIGEEDIATEAGNRRTWHVSRTPRAGSHDQTIDIWLGPQEGWHPVKIKYTYANGDWLELSLARLQPLGAS
jgi:hypothetical protein